MRLHTHWHYGSKRILSHATHRSLLGKSIHGIDPSCEGGLYVVGIFFPGGRGIPIQSH